MKLTLVFILLTSMATLLWFCKPVTYTAENMPKKMIKWGNGGGVVGKETAYVLIENGQMFKIDGASGSPVAFKKIKSKTAKALFNAATTFEMTELDLNDPGNMYKFIELGSEDGTPVRLTWGGDTEVPQKVSDLMTVLGQLLNKE